VTNQPLNIRKKDSTAILQSLGSGVVPRTGLEHIVVGRAAEIRQMIKELENVAEGAAAVKFLAGSFGSGKSFLLALIRQIALAKKFVVAEADFSPDRRLYGEGKGVATYTALMNGLTTQSRPDGQALPAIIERWISQVQTEVANREGLAGVAFDDPAFVTKVQAQIRSILTQIEGLTGGFDFAEVVNAYYRGYAQDNEELTRSALRWLRAEYKARSDARRDLGVRGIIDDANWYDHLKVFASFVTQIGYAGLVVELDEAINLYKISHAQNRSKNYEVILNIFNDAQQGRAGHVYLVFAGTPEFISDERRGLSSYEALKRRIQTNPFETEVFRDLEQPVMTIPPLLPEELLTLLLKLRTIHSCHHGVEPLVAEAQVQTFLAQLLSRPGARQYLTAGDVVRSFLHALNLLQQNPNMDRTAVFTGAAQEAEEHSRAARLTLKEQEQEPTEENQGEVPPLGRFHVKH